MKAEAKALRVGPRILEQARKNVEAAMRRRMVVGMSYFYLALTPFFWVIGIVLMNKSDIETAKCGAGVTILSLGPYLGCIAMRLVGGDTLAGRMMFFPGMFVCTSMFNFPKGMARWTSSEITLCDAEVLAINVLGACLLVTIVHAFLLARNWFQRGPSPSLWDTETDLPLAPKGHP
jgi:hypothetical protein